MRFNVLCILALEFIPRWILGINENAARYQFHQTFQYGINRLILIPPCYLFTAYHRNPNIQSVHRYKLQLHRKNSYKISVFFVA